jgi:hypothetical protein
MNRAVNVTDISRRHRPRANATFHTIKEVTQSG